MDLAHSLLRQAAELAEHNDFSIVALMQAPQDADEGVLGTSTVSMCMAMPHIIALAAVEFLDECGMEEEELLQIQELYAKGHVDVNRDTTKAWPHQAKKK